MNEHLFGVEEKASAAAQLAFKPFGTGKHLCLGYQPALDKRRTIKFDEVSVKIENGLFPPEANKVSGRGRVLVGYLDKLCVFRGGTRDLHA